MDYFIQIIKARKKRRKEIEEDDGEYCYIVGDDQNLNGNQL